MHYALATPLPGLSLLQRLLWPLIYMQLVTLRDSLRAQYGRGVPYWISISRLGRVRLHRLPMDGTFSDAAPVSCERFGHAYTTGLARAVLASACAEEITPPAPAAAPGLAAWNSPLLQTQSGRATSQGGTARPDTS